jgi:hypothetical protein
MSSLEKVIDLTDPTWENMNEIHQLTVTKNFDYLLCWILEQGGMKGRTAKTKLRWFIKPYNDYKDILIGDFGYGESQFYWNDLTVSNDDKYFAALYFQGKKSSVKVIQASDGILKTEFSLDGIFNGISLSPNASKIIIFSTASGIIVVWDLVQNRQFLKIETKYSKENADWSKFNDAIFMDEDNIILTDRDGIKIFNIHRNITTKELNNQIYGTLEISDDDLIVFTGDYLSLINTKNWNQELKYNRPMDASIIGVGVKSKYALLKKFGQGEGEYILYDFKNKKEVGRYYNEFSNAPSYVFFDETGKKFLFKDAARVVGID